MLTLKQADRWLRDYTHYEAKNYLDILRMPEPLFYAMTNGEELFKLVKEQTASPFQKHYFKMAQRVGIVGEKGQMTQRGLRVKQGIDWRHLY